MASLTQRATYNYAMAETTSVTHEGKATLRAYYFESAHLFEEPCSFIASLIAETEGAVVSIKRIDCETVEEAQGYVERWARRYDLNDRS